ncbi:MAG: response regulator, partial [Burkholderiaceae bacterium]|nr:response regulator [Burkholderiaceae bacterium]
VSVFTACVVVLAIAPVLQTLETRFAPLAEQRALHFRVRTRTGVYLRTDPALLVEMLMNLLSNAFRYTERGGVLLGTRLRGDRLVIQVWDTGPGIAPGDMAAIFEEFVQLGGSARDRRHGLGLGLAIVRRLGKALECPVSVRSRPGKGTVFDVSIPISREPALRPAGETEGDTGDDTLRGMLVLVVDDELDILVAMEAILAAWGCYVLVARSVAEARQHLQEALRFPDVLITDHRLANAETSEDVVAMVERSVPVPVPVILVSGEVGPRIEAQVRERGWPLLSKPVNPQRLRALLIEVLAAHPPQG